MDHTDKYWFRAKRYGLGWGLPVRWQGWVVLASYGLSVKLVSHFWPPATDTGKFVAGVIASTVALLCICWMKGEPLRWRWGKR